MVFTRVLQSEIPHGHAKERAFRQSYKNVPHPVAASVAADAASGEG